VRTPSSTGHARVVASLVVAGLFAGSGAGCTGPGTHIDNPAGHVCFVDGRHETATDLPFRYYGTSRVDALPADTKGRPDWDRQPASQVVEHPAPASPWLFPLDFPIELVRRVWSGREDRTVVIELAPTPPEQRVLPEVRPTGLDAVEERARQARIAR
jgi:hypothetical protein